MSEFISILYKTIADATHVSTQYFRAAFNTILAISVSYCVAIVHTTSLKAGVDRTREVGESKQMIGVMVYEERGTRAVIR